MAFEVERSTGLASAQFRQCISLWPGRDQYIDHTAAIEAGRAVHPFRLADLEDTPHHLYLAHDRLLALDGTAFIEVEFELVRPSSEPLEIAWEYWDGEVWRGFRGTHPLCGEDERADGTGGLVRSGVVRLESDCAESKPTMVAGIDASWIRGRLSERMLPTAPLHPPEVAGIRLSTRLESPLPRAVVEVSSSASEVTAVGLLPDMAVADGAPVELTEPFYPLGEQPQPGSTFYVALDEAFGRPGAQVEVYVRKAATPQDRLEVATTSGSVGAILSHLISWEYWDGFEWRPLFAPYTNEPVNETDPRDFTGNGLVEFTVPRRSAGRRWTGRRRSGCVSGYSAAGSASRNGSRGSIPRTHRHRFATSSRTSSPSLRRCRISGSATSGRTVRTRPITSSPSTISSMRTEPTTRAGRGLPSALTVRFATSRRRCTWGSIAGCPSAASGSSSTSPRPRILRRRAELVWEYYNGATWTRLSVDDGTQQLGVPGILSLIGPADSESLRRFGQPLHWIRGRLKEDRPPNATEIRKLHPNAVWAVQRETIRDEPLGSGNGLPNQVVEIPRIPVLPGEWIEVRELDGGHARMSSGGW